MSHATIERAITTGRGVRARRRRTSTSTTTSGSSATTTRSWSSTPPTTTRPIVEAVDGRRVRAIVLTHGHNDHINAAVPAARRGRRPDLAAPRRPHAVGRRVARRRARPRHPATAEAITAGGHELLVLHTPGPLPRRLLLPRRRSTASSSPATRCSAADRAPPVAASATSRRSCARSATRCSPCPTTPSCTPATATRRRSAPNGRRPRPRRRTGRLTARPRDGTTSRVVPPIEAQCTGRNSSRTVVAPIRVPRSRPTSTALPEVPAEQDARLAVLDRGVRQSTVRAGDLGRAPALLGVQLHRVAADLERDPVRAEDAAHDLGRRRALDAVPGVVLGVAPLVRSGRHVRSPSVRGVRRRSRPAGSPSPGATCCRRRTWRPSWRCSHRLAPR